MGKSESSYVKAVEEVLSGKKKQGEIFKSYSAKEMAYIGVAIMLVTRYGIKNDNIVVGQRGLVAAFENLLLKCSLDTVGHTVNAISALSKKAERIRDEAKKLNLYETTRKHVVVVRLTPSPALQEVIARYGSNDKKIQAFMRDVEASVQYFDRAHNVIRGHFFEEMRMP